MEPTAGSGSGAAEPVEEDRIQEPDSSASSSSNGDAAPPPSPASATPLHREQPRREHADGPPSAAVPRLRSLDLERPRREQAGGGADGSTSATAVEPRKGKEIAPPSPPSSTSSSSSSSSTHSLDKAIAQTLRASPLGGGESTSAAGGRESTSTADGRARATWSDPLVAETREEEPNAAARPSDSKLAFGHRLIERLAIQQAAVDEANVLWEQQAMPNAAAQPLGPNLEFDLNLVGQRLIERLAKEEAAINEEKLSQAKVVVKVESKQDNLGINWSQLMNRIFHREGREICSEHVNHQTHPITEVRRHHRLASDEANHLDAYSEYRSVIGDGECFYRSFIFSYLEQVIDRQDTHEEHRLLRVVERMSMQHANLRWNSDFIRSSKAFKNLIKKIMRRKHGRDSTSSYRKEKLLKFFSKYDTTLDSERNTLEVIFLLFFIIHVSDTFSWLVFIFLRLVVAIQICSHREVYEPLIPGLRGNYNLEDWCLQRVTPARQLTDHVMMEALARALEVPLRVERVRGGYDPDIYTGPGVPRPRVTLLYSANHYEIIYPRAPSDESSSHQASQREDLADESSSQQTSQREDPADESSSHQASQREDPSAESSSHQASQREDPADESPSHQAPQREDPADES
uniref:OTU domain-containing protein n=1 Tax=Hordeum vulgare subsp. vulgare TaxID=112509 RepID=A0A8I7BGB8_HORVV